MRGKGKLPWVGMRDIRITPAYAGKSEKYMNQVPKLQDHPRLCGEKLVDGQTYEDHKGSPPPMRGKVTDFANACKFEGITPAYAGKRQDNERLTSGNEDHPRLCGEKSKQ